MKNARGVSSRASSSGLVMGNTLSDLGCLYTIRKAWGVRVPLGLWRLVFGVFVEMGAHSDWVVYVSLVAAGILPLATYHPSMDIKKRPTLASRPLIPGVKP